MYKFGEYNSFLKFYAWFLGPNFGIFGEKSKFLVEFFLNIYDRYYTEK